MTDDPDGKRGPDGRFRKGNSGNPHGRPRGRSNHQNDEPTGLEILMEIKWSLTENGQTVEMTTAQALRHQTLKRAFEDDRPSQKTVLKWVRKRQKMRAERRRRGNKNAKPIPWTFVDDIGDRSNEAMEILDIASTSSVPYGPANLRPVLIETWAAQAAISRHRKLGELRPDQLQLINAQVHRAEELVWPGDLNER